MTIQCIIINKSLSYIIQLLINCISLLSLYIKRNYFEFPKRNYKIWKYDIYKITIGSFFAHIIDIIISISISDNLSCQWYFINFITDTFVGTFIAFILIKIVNYIANNYNIPNIEMGYYGQDYLDDNDSDNDNDNDNDNDIDNNLFINEFNNTRNSNTNKFKIFIVQTVLWCLVIVYIKIILLFTILLPVKNNLKKNGSFYILQPITNKNIESVIVIIIIQLILNIIQIVLYDIILKKKIIIKNEEEPTNEYSIEAVYADL